MGDNMPKDEYIIRKLGSSKYKYYKCHECHIEGKEVDATYSSGPRDKEGIGYNVRALCEKHNRSEFMKHHGLTEEDKVNDITIQNCTY